MEESETAFLFMLLFSIVALGVVATFHILAFFPAGITSGIFEHQMLDNWDHYEIDVVINAWQFPVWVAVYILQFLWLIYAMVILCRDTKVGSLIVNPPIMPSSLFFTFIFALAGTMGWVVLFDMRDYFTWYSAICSLATTIFMTFTVAISLHATNLYQDEVIEQGYACDVWTIRSMVQNAAAAYATWASVETTYTVGLILYETKLVNIEQSNYIILGIMMTYVIIFMTVDMFWGRQLSCLILSPYVIYIIGFAQPFIKFYGDDFNILFVLSAVFLGVTVAMLLLKLVLMTGRCFCERKLKKKEPLEQFGAVRYQEDGSEFMDYGPEPVRGVDEVFSNPKY
jgi:hypothetical protein